MVCHVEPTPITVVDDDPALRELLANALPKWNYVPQLAADAEQAFDVFQAHPTPILLTDLHMPGRGGMWLVEEVRKRWPETLTVVLTASKDLDAAIHCLNAGARRYLLKPFDLEQIRGVLAEVVAAWQRRRERSLEQRRLEEIVSRQTRRARGLFLSGIESLFAALEARDPYISGHSQRVRHYALALGRKLKLEEKQLRQLSLAAKLHDIGKVAIPEGVLHKAGVLTEEERLVIQAHAVIGADIVRPLVRNRAVLAAIRGHHERIDGQGYPDGLVGHEIPVLARVISIADCFDALTSARPYRGQLSRVRAVEVLHEVAGTQLDAGFVPHFVELLADNPYLAPTSVPAQEYTV
jgi:putative nucleotidyltransferase with HDIG domain